jgi:hypothetical protein
MELFVLIETLDVAVLNLFADAYRFQNISVIAPLTLSNNDFLALDEFEAEKILGVLSKLDNKMVIGIAVKYLIDSDSSVNKGVKTLSHRLHTTVFLFEPRIILIFHLRSPIVNQLCGFLILIHFRSNICPNLL